MPSFHLCALRNPLFVVLLLAYPIGLYAQGSDAVPMTIFHTNDLQSRLLGFGPNADYSPEIANNDQTIGGIARLAAVLNRRRSELSGASTALTFDGGDVMMGTLFHTVSRETGTEFQLLKHMSYDAITLGNHDFDFRPDGLAAALVAAQQGEGVPPIVLSNIQYSAESKQDDALEELAAQGVIQPSLVIEKGGLRFGVIGVMGWHAMSVIGEAEPVSFMDPVVAIQRQVDALKAQGVDVFVLLSHGGVYPKQGDWKGDDIDIAKAIPDLDLIISGHSHRITPAPVKVGGTLIVQAGSEGRYLGELSLTWLVKEKRLTVERYQLHEIDDGNVGLPEVSALVDQAKRVVSQQVLAPYGLSFEQPVVEVSRYLTRRYDDPILGNIAADSMRLAAKADVAITSNGEIRDELLPGKMGVQHVSDIFRIFPIGIGYQDNSPGYDLVKVYFTAPELKSLMEILLIGYQIKGPSFYPRISGIEVSYNPYRMPFDKVNHIALSHLDRGQVLDLSRSNTELYSVTMTHYAFKFMRIVNELSYGLLTAVPKDEFGKPVKDIARVLVDSDPHKQGIQRQKAWSGLLSHLLTMKDSNANGIADIDTDFYSEQRIVETKSIHPSDLLRHSNGITVTVYTVIVLVMIGLSVFLMIRWCRRP